MLKINDARMAELEQTYPGIGESIRRFEASELPNCPHCNSRDTATVICGIVGRTINIAAASTKVKVIPNGPAPGNLYCNSCNSFADAPKLLRRTESDIPIIKGLPPWLGGGAGNGNVSIIGGVQNHESDPNNEEDDDAES